MPEIHPSAIVYEGTVLGEGVRVLENAVVGKQPSLGATSMQVALAWLLQRSPNILLIPGTSSVHHLRENLKAATLHLPPEILADLNAIGSSTEHKDSPPQQGH